MMDDIQELLTKYKVNIATFPCLMTLGGSFVMSTTVDGSATRIPPSTTKSRP